MRQFYLTLLFLFAISITRAGALSQSTGFMIPSDTVPYVLDEDEMMDYNDSLISFMCAFEGNLNGILLISITVFINKYYDLINFNDI